MQDLHSDFKLGESGTPTLEYWITPFNYADAELPSRSVEAVSEEGKVIGPSCAIIDYD